MREIEREIEGVREREREREVLKFSSQKQRSGWKKMSTVLLQDIFLYCCALDL